jgi:hypothetical protein
MAASVRMRTTVKKAGAMNDVIARASHDPERRMKIALIG